MPESLLASLQPLLAALDALKEQIKKYEQLLQEMARQSKEVQPLLTIHVVGELTAMAFVLTLEDPSRFQKRRDVGAYLGLVPKQWQTETRSFKVSARKHGR